MNLWFDRITIDCNVFDCVVHRQMDEDLEEDLFNTVWNDVFMFVERGVFVTLRAECFFKIV